MHRLDSTYVTLGLGRSLQVWERLAVRAADGEYGLLEDGASPFCLMVEVSILYEGECVLVVVACDV